jgi:hypothetical protein
MDEKYKFARRMGVALAFGLGAFLMMVGGITLRLPGTQLVSDPREILVTLGAAFTGPLGGVLIGFLAGVYDPVPGMNRVTVVMHILGALWIGYGYKKLLFERLTYPKILAGWVGLMLVYYYLILLPVVVFFSYLWPDLYQMVFKDVPPFQAYLNVLQPVSFEFALTTVVTMLVLVMLPRNYRKPLW